jgi:hypothetical protein
MMSENPESLASTVLTFSCCTPLHNFRCGISKPANQQGSKPENKQTSLRASKQTDKLQSQQTRLPVNL